MMSTNKKKSCDIQQQKSDSSIFFLTLTMLKTNCKKNHKNFYFLDKNQYKTLTSESKKSTFLWFNKDKRVESQFTESFRGKLFAKINSTCVHLILKLSFVVCYIYLHF